MHFTTPGDIKARIDILLATRQTLFKWQGKRREQRHDLETLTELAEKLTDQSQYAAAPRSTCAKLNMPRLTGDYETGLGFVQEAVGQAEKADDGRKEAAAYALWGRILTRMGQYGEAQEWLELAQELSQPNEDAWFIAHVTYALAANYYAGNRLGIASEHFQKALAGYEQIFRPRGVVDCQQMLGGIALVSGQYDVALTYLQDALNATRTLGWRRGEALALGTLGTAYEILERMSVPWTFKNRLWSFADH